MKDKNLKPIRLFIKYKNGETAPLDELPSSKQAEKELKLADKVALILSNEPKIQRLFNKYGKYRYSNITYNVIKQAALIILNDGIVTVRQTRTPKRNYDKFKELKQSLEESQKVINRLGNGLFTDYCIATQHAGLEIDTVQKLIDVCEDLIKYRSYPKAPYYSALIGALSQFRSYRFDLFNRVSPENQALDLDDWDFFKKLITHIHFKISDEIDLPFDRIQDTKKGLNCTFEKLRELNPQFFCC